MGHPPKTAAPRPKNTNETQRFSVMARGKGSNLRASDNPHGARVNTFVLRRAKPGVATRSRGPWTSGQAWTAGAADRVAARTARRFPRLRVSLTSYHLFTRKEGA